MFNFRNTQGVLSAKQPELTRRLFTGGFETMGRINRGPDTRTTEQLLNNIDYYSGMYPEVKKFKEELKSMNPKHLGLISDICELANYHEMVNNAIDIKKVAYNGKSLFEFLLEKLPQASKQNPESVELSKAIIDNTDSTASKYALASLVPFYDCKEAAAHIKATIPLVGDIAEATLSGGYLMDYSKEQNFVNALNSFISKSVNLEKLEKLFELTKLAENTKARCIIDAFPFLTNKTPMSKIDKNLKTFEQLDENMEGKSINLTEFLEKNINLV